MIVKLIAPVLMLAVLSACRPSEPPKQGANMPTVEELASDPERLKELRRQCKTERPTMGDWLDRFHAAFPERGRGRSDALAA